MTFSTFVLGAGFSKWFHSGMPLMTDLMKCVLNTPEISREIDRLGLTKLCEHQNSFEALISYLHSTYPWKKTIEIHSEMALYEKCIEVAIDSLKLAEAGIPFDEVDGTRQRLFLFWQNSQAKIVSFNYDTIVERGLQETRNADWFGYYKLPLIDIEKRGAEPQGLFFGDETVHDSINKSELFPTLTKLHGSVNWYHSGNFSHAFEAIYYHHPNARGTNFEIKRSGLRPLIIPPSLDKSKFYEHPLLALTWSKARADLETSEEVYLVGYSLPEADTYVDMLFKRSLRDGTHVHFVNDDTSPGFRERMESRFANMGLNLDFEFTTKGSIEKLIRHLTPEQH